MRTNNVTIRLDSALGQQLEQMAAAESRPLAAMARILLREAMALRVKVQEVAGMEPEDEMMRRTR